MSANITNHRKYCDVFALYCDVFALVCDDLRLFAIDLRLICELFAIICDCDYLRYISQIHRKNIAITSQSAHFITITSQLHRNYIATSANHRKKTHNFALQRTLHLPQNVAFLEKVRHFFGNVAIR